VVGVRAGKAVEAVLAVSEVAAAVVVVVVPALQLALPLRLRSGGASWRTRK